jgi:hypothetical protein
MNLSVVVIALIVLVNWMLWRIYSKNILHPLLTLCIWSAFSMWYLVPGVISTIYQEETPFFPLYLQHSEATMDIWLENFNHAFILETISVVGILGLVLFFKGKKNIQRNNVKLTYETNGETEISTPFKVVILACFLAMLIYQALTLKDNVYITMNSAELYGSSDWFLVLIKQVSLAMTVLLAVYEKKRSPLIYLALALIVVDAYQTSFQGNRIILLAPVIVLIFRNLINRKQNEKEKKNLRHSQKYSQYFKIFGLLFISLCFLWYVFIPVAQTFEKARLSGSINWSEILLNSTQEVDNKAAVSTIFWKLDSFTGGSILTREVGYGEGGITPFIGSLLVVVPRAIVPNRPIAGTSDGTIYTYPSRLVPASIGIESDYFNVGVSPLHISFWELSEFGFIVYIVFNFIYFRFLNWLLNSPYFLLKSLAIYSVSLPTFANVFASPDAVLKIMVILLVFVGLIKFYNYFILDKISARFSGNT